VFVGLRAIDDADHVLVRDADDLATPCFNCPGSRAVRDHRYSFGLARLAVHHGRDAGSRIGWPSQGIGWLVWVPSSYLIGLVEAAPGRRLKVVGRFMRQTGVENIYRTDRNRDVEFVTNGRDL